MDPESLKDAPLDDLLKAAWQSRLSGRPSTFDAIYPVKTLAVSVTGQKCSLNCSHCGGHYLEHMVDLAHLREEVEKEKPQSILLSGGCDLSGAVPLKSHLAYVEALAEEEARKGAGFKINVHPGVASPEVARAIGEAASVISFDFVLDDETIKEAFHGMWTGQDYIDTFRNLRKGKAEVIPHVLIGLRRGQISGEYRAVDFLIREGIDKLIFIIFIPTPNTAWESASPPPVQEVARLMAWARVKAPGLQIALGCMRPSGGYRREVDCLAVRCGVDRIVLPHKDSVSLASSLKLEVFRKEECCVFD